MTLRNLIFVKHSLPLIEPEKSAEQWRLSKAGRLRCQPLAEKLAKYQPTVVASSLEPKALETARLVAHYLNLPHKGFAGLQELDRSNVPLLESVERYRDAVEAIFENQEELVFGQETAVQAGMRFARALDKVIEDSPTGTPVIVSHGIVITLFLNQFERMRPFAFWRRLGMPSYVVLDMLRYRVTEVLDLIP